jgi:hypothetical protein
MSSNDEPQKDNRNVLSSVSKRYDVGDKGFLTDIEQEMRGMDSDNVGHLTNAKVSAIVSETLALREKTDRMKTWIGILGVFVVILALSNLGTAFAAAWLAKDTTVNESTGVLLMKDSDTPVAVQSYGQTSNLVLDTRRNLFHANTQGHRGTQVDPIYTQPRQNPGGAVDLGKAGKYAILAKTGISTVPQSSITGKIGVSPISGAAITGFDLTLASNGAFSTASQLTGRAFAADYTRGTPAKLITAVSNMEAAYTDAAGRVNPIASRKNPNGQLIGTAGAFGSTVDKLTAGVYTFTTGVKIDGDVHFEGDGNDIFIIQIAGNLRQAADTKVTLHGNVKPENIFWQVAGFVRLASTATMKGILLVKTHVTFVTGSTLIGRVLTQTACNLQMATITPP